MATKLKRQFKRTAKPRLFFDRRVRQTGNTVSISLGKVIPKGWYYVRIELIDREADSVTIKLSRLLEMSTDASDTKANKRSGKNT